MEKRGFAQHHPQFFALYTVYRDVKTMCVEGGGCVCVCVLGVRKQREVETYKSNYTGETEREELAVEGLMQCRFPIDKLAAPRGKERGERRGE